MVLLIVIVGLLYIASNLARKEAEEKTTETQKTPSDLKPLTNYAEACFEEVAKKGLRLLGNQGGNIYESQGGKKTNYQNYMEGKFYLEYNNYKVPYKILLPVAGLTCDPNIPNYPTKSLFPYPYKQTQTTPQTDFNNPIYLNDKRYHHQDCFGKRRVLDSERSLEDLQSYMEFKIPEECSFSSFKNYNVVSTEPKVNIESFTKSTVFNITYPLTITNKNTQTETSLHNFRISLKFSIEELYNYINDIIELDVSDPTFDIGLKDPDYDFDVLISHNIYQNDDVITISSDSLVLSGIPYNFVFARRNRYPILEYVYNTSFTSLSSTEFSWNDIIHQELKAVDPDEDNVNIIVTLGQGHNSFILTKNIQYPITNQLVNISVSDGQYSDYQSQNFRENFVIQ